MKPQEMDLVDFVVKFPDLPNRVKNRMMMAYGRGYSDIRTVREFVSSAKLQRQKLGKENIKAIEDKFVFDEVDPEELHDSIRDEIFKASKQDSEGAHNFHIDESDFEQLSEEIKNVVLKQITNN